MDEPIDSASDPALAGVLLIGDELLSGKIQDENGVFLARMLRRRGIRLVEIRTVGDDIHAIGSALHDLCARASIVFTSGGVGPTHDDRTLLAIATATGRPLRRDAQMEADLIAHYGERITDAALRMADVPEGTMLRAGPGWPVLRLDLPSTRVYILPGVPGLLRAKIERLEQLDDELPKSGGWHLAELYTTRDESRLAALLDAVLARHPGVEIGSYPRWARGDDGRISFHVRVTFEAPVARTAEVDRACDELRAALAPDEVLPSTAAGRPT